MKAVQAGILAVSVCFSLGATDSSSRFNDLGHRMMCICGCAQMLGECNHVGCPESGHMRDELSAAIAAGTSDQEILASFASKYGATVLAAPTTHGFDLVGWIAPFAVFAAALLGTILLVRRWKIDPVVAQTASASADAAILDPAAKTLREQIRRETGTDGGR
jgi:cytochrome c-type biogenesis protein CcmH/NrfF